MTKGAPGRLTPAASKFCCGTSSCTSYQIPGRPQSRCMSFESSGLPLTVCAPETTQLFDPGTGSSETCCKSDCLNDICESGAKSGSSSLGSSCFAFLCEVFSAAVGG